MTKHGYLLALAAMASMIGLAAVDQHIATGRPFPTKVDPDEPTGKKRVRYRNRIGKRNDRKDKEHRLKGLRP